MREWMNNDGYGGPNERGMPVKNRQAVAGGKLPAHDLTRLVNDFGFVNAVKSKDVDRFGVADLSACAAFRPVGTGTDKVNEELNVFLDK
jgi:hypothetical protein